MTFNLMCHKKNSCFVLTHIQINILHLSTEYKIKTKV